MRRNMAPIMAVVLSVFMLISVFSACSILYAASDDGFGWKFVILGDTQDFAAHRPDLFFNATQWIASQSDIIYVTQMGDLVDNRDNLTQWQTAYDAMHVLDGHASWGVVPGNHDLQGVSGTGEGGENTTNFNTFFGDCEHYDIVKNRFIFIYIRHDHPDYAEEVLQAHPRLYAIIVVHANLGGSQFDVGLHERLAKYDNVIAVFSGHHLGASFLRYFHGQGGIDNLILTDYQDLKPLTNALKVCTVFQDRIEVETFEPMTNTYRDKSLYMEKFSFPYGRDLNAGFLDEEKLFAQTDIANVDIKIADLTSDTGNEVVVAGGADNTVAVFNSTGSQIASVYQEQPYSLEVIDLNDDGKLEIVCGGKDLIVYDANLQPLETLLSNRNSTRPVMVTVADVDKNKIPELLAVDYDNNSLTRLRVWNGYSRVVDVWVEENLPPMSYEPRNISVPEFVETTLPNGTITYETVLVNKTETYADVWPTSPTVIDLNGDGENEVYVNVPSPNIVAYDDSYAYTGYYHSWGTKICADEDGDGKLDVYGINNQVFNKYSVSPLGYFYVGGSPLNLIGYDLDGDGDMEILWTDENCNICIYDEGRMSAVNSAVANLTLYAGSLRGDGTTDVLAATDGAIYVYEDFRPAYATEELQNINNEYWLENQPNVMSANATLTEISNQQAAWYSVNTKFTAAVNLTQGENVQIQIDVGLLGKPTGTSVSEWTYNETSKTVTCNLTDTKSAVTLYWIKTDEKEVSLVLPYLAVACFTLGWLYMTAVLPKKRNTKIQRKTVVFGVLIAAAAILLLLLANFII
jgi:hypothetical protein